MATIDLTISIEIKNILRWEDDGGSIASQEVEPIVLLSTAVFTVIKGSHPCH